MITNSSFFISNEKNTSLFTQLVSDTKYIVITFISYVVLRSFAFTWKNITGLFLSTLAAIIITVNSLYNNIKFKPETNKENSENSGDTGDVNENSGLNNSKDVTKFKKVNIAE